MMGHRALMAAAADAYRTGAVVFDGTNDYLTRGAAWTGSPADGGSLLASFWIKFNGGDGAEQFILGETGTSSDDIVSRTAGDVYNFDTRTTVGTQIGISVGTGTWNSADGWHHVLCAFSKGANQYLYVDGAQEDSDVPANSDYGWTETEWIVGAKSGGLAKLNADLADVYLTNEYLDISLAANRAKFALGGKPVDLGGDGSKPTGTAPLLFLRRVPGAAASTFAANKGSGGGMTITGALANAGTSPTD